LNFGTTVKTRMNSRHGWQKKALPEFEFIGFEHRGQVMPAKRGAEGLVPGLTGF